jgi:hypothetical protein
MSKPAEKPTTFDWSGRHRSSWTLALLIFGSLLVHSSAFFLIQIRTPERNVIPETAQPIQLLTPYAPDGSPSEENAAVLRWLEAEDPAVVARVATVEPAGLLDVPFRPSFAVSRTRPRDVPQEPSTIQYPPARDSMQFILHADARPAPEVAATTGTKTKVFFAGAVKARAPVDLEIKPSTTSGESLSSVELLIGIAASGTVKFCLVQSGSGAREMDAEAVRLVSNIKLQPSEAALEWGTATVRWGIDAVAERP